MAGVFSHFAQLASREAQLQPWNVSIGSYDIYRCVEVLYDGVEESYTETAVYVLATMTEDDLAPARYFTDSPGFQPSVTVRWSDPDTDALAAFLMWTILSIDLTIDIIEQWSTGGLAVEIDTRETTIIEGKVFAWTNAIQFDALSEQIITGGQAVAYTGNSDTEGDDIYTFGSFSRPSSSTTSLDSGSAARAIEGALNDIASQDYDMTINNGRGIWSVRTKVTTGT